MVTAVILLILMGAVWTVRQVLFEQAHIQRRSYYREDYMQSEAWRRKRYQVFKRDHWRCVYCGGRATRVHHMRYAKKHIDSEPIKWLVSVCKDCHEARQT